MHMQSQKWLPPSYLHHYLPPNLEVPHSTRQQSGATSLKNPGATTERDLEVSIDCKMNVSPQCNAVAGRANPEIVPDSGGIGFLGGGWPILRPVFSR